MGLHYARKAKTIWTTQLCGRAYLLDDEGRLQPARKAPPMATTFIQNMREDPEPNALRAVPEELHALALRRAAHHAQQQRDTSTEEQR